MGCFRNADGYDIWLRVDRMTWVMMIFPERWGNLTDGLRFTPAEARMK